VPSTRTSSHLCHIECLADERQGLRIPAGHNRGETVSTQHARLSLKSHLASPNTEHPTPRAGPSRLNTTHWLKTSALASGAVARMSSRRRSSASTLVIHCPVTYAGARACVSERQGLSVNDGLPSFACPRRGRHQLSCRLPPPMCPSLLLLLLLLLLLGCCLPHPYLDVAHCRPLWWVDLGLVPSPCSSQRHPVRWGVRLRVHGWCRSASGVCQNGRRTHGSAVPSSPTATTTHSTPEHVVQADGLAAVRAARLAARRRQGLLGARVAVKVSTLKDLQPGRRGEHLSECAQKLAFGVGSHERAAAAQQGLRA
jgi:hypothetical protein